jgi:DNA-directed RNA polymerase sigma subunit (sigma70/sigma32)
VTEKTLKLLDAINKWLDDVFGEGKRLSQLLSESGLEDAEIQRLKTHHLTEFIETVLNLISETTDKHDGERRNDVMIRHYGLMSGEAETLQAIGDTLGLSRERIRQLVNKRLQLYRHPKRKERFISEVHQRAKRILEQK